MLCLVRIRSVVAQKTDFFVPTGYVSGALLRKKRIFSFLQGTYQEGYCAKNGFFRSYRWVAYPTGCATEL